MQYPLGLELVEREDSVEIGQVLGATAVVYGSFTGVIKRAIDGPSRL